MDDMAAVNEFEKVVVPKLLREILQEERRVQAFEVNGQDTERLSVRFANGRRADIPRFWEVTAGHPMILKNWIESKVQAALVNTPRSDS